MFLTLAPHRYLPSGLDCIITGLPLGYGAYQYNNGDVLRLSVSLLVCLLIQNCKPESCRVLGFFR
jgi:hypothetical protein